MAHRNRQFLTRLWRYFPAKLRMLPGGGVQFTIPGVTYGDLARSGLPPAWRVQHMLECGYSHLNAAGVDIVPPGPPGTLIMALSTKLSAATNFFQELRIGKPMELRIEPGPVTSKVFTLKFSARYSDRPSDELLSTFCTFGYVDVQKKKLVEIDEHRRQEGLSLVPYQIDPEPVPATHFRWRTTVRHSDENYLSHVGNVGLIHLSLDGASEAVHQGFTGRFGRDLLEYPVREAGMAFQDQTFQGDVLDVLVWEKDGQEDCMCTQIVKGETLVTFGRFRFHKNFKDDY